MFRLIGWIWVIIGFIILAPITIPLVIWIWIGNKQVELEIQKTQAYLDNLPQAEKDRRHLEYINTVNEYYKETR